MSESKYSPEVNAPENVPARVESLQVLFLRLGQYIAVSAADLLLYQVEPGQIGLGLKNDDKFQALILFPGTLTLAEEKKLVTV